MLQQELLNQQKTIGDLNTEGQRILDRSPPAADSKTHDLLNLLNSQSALVDSKLADRLQQLTNALDEVSCSYHWNSTVYCDCIVCLHVMIWGCNCDYCVVCAVAHILRRVECQP